MSVGRYTAHDIAVFAKESATSKVQTLGPEDFPNHVIKPNHPFFVDFFAPVSNFTFFFCQWRRLQRPVHTLRTRFRLQHVWKAIDTFCRASQSLVKPWIPYIFGFLFKVCDSLRNGAFLKNVEFSAQFNVNCWISKWCHQHAHLAMSCSIFCCW